MLTSVRSLKSDLLVFCTLSNVVSSVRRGTSASPKPIHFFSRNKAKMFSPAVYLTRQVLPFRPTSGPPIDVEELLSTQDPYAHHGAYRSLGATSAPHGANASLSRGAPMHVEQSPELRVSPHGASSSFGSDRPLPEPQSKRKSSMSFTACEPNRFVAPAVPLREQGRVTSFDANCDNALQVLSRQAHSTSVLLMVLVVGLDNPYNKDNSMCVLSSPLLWIGPHRCGILCAHPGSHRIKVKTGFFSLLFFVVSTFHLRYLPRKSTQHRVQHSPSFVDVPIILCTLQDTHGIIYRFLCLSTSFRSFPFIGRHNSSRFYHFPPPSCPCSPFHPPPRVPSARLPPRLRHSCCR